MSSFQLYISESAVDDINNAIIYYNQKVPGLGKKFSSQVKKAVKAIQTNPFFQVRYDNTRCIPLKSFPYMLHFTVDEPKLTIEIFGVINTSLDPELFWSKN